MFFCPPSGGLKGIGERQVDDREKLQRLAVDIARRLRNRVRPDTCVPWTTVLLSVSYGIIPQHTSFSQSTRALKAKALQYRLKKNSKLEEKLKCWWIDLELFLKLGVFPVIDLWTVPEKSLAKGFLTSDSILRESHLRLRQEAYKFFIL